MSISVPKTIRIDNIDIHEELNKLLLEVQAKRGKKMKMEDLLAELIKQYKKH
ncbi:MAG TPA: hypothetical protein VJ792_00485 [Candidatus Nitrosotalea sp.]|nr:hypothetical protein [Candidatus Nitrosotalea sp.]